MFGALVRLAALVAAITMICGCTSRGSTKRDYTRLESVVDSLTAVIESLREIELSGRHPISSSDIASLRNQGIRDPIGQLLASLKNRRDLIPFQNSPGESQYGFYYPDGIYVLNRNHVYAYADDGHNSAGVLLQYTFLDSATIRWHVLGGGANK